jgi:hypothetical protein
MRALALEQNVWSAQIKVLTPVTESGRATTRRHVAPDPRGESPEDGAIMPSESLGKSSQLPSHKDTRRR